jgi:hypothetical protein
LPENKESETKKERASGFKTVQYAVIAIIVVLVVAAAVFAVNLVGPQSYRLSVSMHRNGMGAIYPYQESYFIINVTNMGGKQVIGVPVAVYVNGMQQNYSTYTMPPHQSVKINVSYSYTAPGPYAIKAVIDPGNVLNIANWEENGTSTVYLNVSAPELDNVYTSAPGSNITYTEYFSANGTGMLSASVAGSLYNISQLAQVSGLASQITAKLYEDTYQGISVASGAYNRYLNGTSVYVSWLQGTVTPKLLGVIVSSFHPRASAIGSAQNPLYYAQLTNTVSLCYLYSNGWTKLIELDNNSGNGTCVGIAWTNYTGAESNTLISALRSSNTLTRYQSMFVYTNSTPLGNMLEYRNSSLVLYNLFENPHGLFMGQLEQRYSNLTALNNSCIGLVYSANGVNICSVALPQANGAFNSNYSLVLSKYIAPNYTAMLYSFVREADLYAAHYNSAHLIGLLNISTNSLRWALPFRSSCAFPSNSLSCAFVSFSQANSTATIIIKNQNYSPVELTSISCAEAAGFPPVALGKTLARNGTLNVSIKCIELPIQTPGVALVTNYLLDLNYTYNSHSLELNGTLNVTNIAS